MTMTSKKKTPSAPPRATQNHPAGFTLIEVLVAVIVIGIGCLGASMLQSAAMRSNSQADHVTVASFLAESELERLRSLNFANIQQEAHGGDQVLCLNRSGQSVATTGGTCTNQDYPYTRKIEFLAAAPTTRSHSVEMSISWSDAHGPHTLIYSAAITDFSF